jgi:hypothetical protein
MTAPDPWVRLAVDLHQLAERVASLAGKAHPATSVSFTVQPGPWNGSDEEKIAAVNTVARTLLGVDGHEKRVGTKDLHHDASGVVGEISVGVFRGLSRKAGAK